MTAAMLTSSFLDLGFGPAAGGLPGAPPTVAAGVTVPDFARAMTDLMAGTAPAALAQGVSTNRQVVADTGKPLPFAAPLAPQVWTDLPDCEMPDPSLLPSIDPAAATPVAGSDDATDTVDAPLDPALAWLLPPVPTPMPIKVGPIVEAAAPPPAPAALPDAAPAAIGTAIKAPSSPPGPLADGTVKAAPLPPVGQPVVTSAGNQAAPGTKAILQPLPPLAGLGDCDMPAELPDPVETAIRTSTPGAPAPATPVIPLAGTLTVPNIMPAAPPPIAGNAGSVRTSRVPAPAINIARDPNAAQVTSVSNPGARPVPGQVSEPTPPTIPGIATPGAAATPGPVKTPVATQAETALIDAKTVTRATRRQPIVEATELRVRTDAAPRLEIQPLTSPARDFGATLAAAAAIRAAPVSMADAATGNTSTPLSLDTGQLAPIAAGAPAAQPVGAAQQAGIDLAHDHGLHRMIDRIEHLRDAFDARDTRIRLIPDALGPVDISVRRDATSDAVQVHFTAAEAGTRQLIADAQQRLVDLADSRGIRIDRATVDGGNTNSAGQQAWSGGEQSRPQQQAQTAPQSRAPVRAARDAEPDSTDKRIA